jgi:hypothetical protein
VNVQHLHPMGVGSVGMCGMAEILRTIGAGDADRLATEWVEGSV